jgi:hypothetical protein
MTSHVTRLAIAAWILLCAWGTTAAQVTQTREAGDCAPGVDAACLIVTLDGTGFFKGDAANRQRPLTAALIFHRLA